MKIILVEDDLELNNVLATFFKLNSVECKFFSNPREAIEFVESNYNILNIDAFVVDVMMPHISGLEFLNIIKNLFPQSYIIMMSGNTDFDFIKKAYELGCNDFIKKPFCSQELLYKLNMISNNDKINLNGKVSLIMKRQSVILDNNEVSLTKKEYLFLELLCKNANTLVTQEMIERYVFDNKSMMETSIRSLVTRVRKKIGKDVFKTVTGRGYLLLNES